MPDFKAMYFSIYNKVTDAINILQKAQQEGEKSFVECEDVPIILFQNMDTDRNED